MTTWDEFAALIRDAGDPRSPRAQQRIYELVVDTPPDAEAMSASAVPGAEALAAVDRTWLAGLGEDPTRMRDEIDAAIAACRTLRRHAGLSALPLRYAEVELYAYYGQRDDALEHLRVARLFSFDTVDVDATLATARIHGDYSGVIRTTTAVPTRPDADPAATALGLAASLLPYLAQRRRVEAEDALAALGQVDIPTALRLRLLGDELEYLGLSGQWERGLARLRHTDAVTDEASAWSLLNAAVGVSLVLREANRAGYGSNAIGSSLRWDNPWAAPPAVTGWDTVVHAYDAVTAFARALAARFDGRNGNNAISYRTESRMAAEAAGLAARSYGTVTGPADARGATSRKTLLKNVNQLLVLARGYGLEAVRERALVTAETISRSLSEETDDSQLEAIVDLRIAFARLLLELGADERAEREALDTTELCLSQGWVELACASLATAARATHVRGDRAATATHCERMGELMDTWPMGRVGERIGTLVEAVGRPETSCLALAILAERLAAGAAEDHSRAAAAREACKRCREQLDCSKTPPEGVLARVQAVEEAIAPYGRGRGGRHRADPAQAPETGQ
ncbi:hypothetical protein SAMN05216355_10921 [Actinomyces ruminicola]|uniref:Uncharacterized protein n=1 Tax=Actinomyces ruminicola TaxID=332524 RepID=A0A1H0D537_9ACTO|nr:hypothetical protein [Actinomyces ruminicola]SDN65175.1 hypothetical protein SAMN05216355_10921 [Actinomyces ruminicola]